MKILSRENIQKLDSYTIKNEPISSLNLMERASEKFCEWFRGIYDNSKIVRILCGPGNNGGDGLAIARILHQKGFKTEVDLILGSPNQSKDGKTNLNRLPREIPLRIIKELKDIPLSYSSEIVIDAIFGSGLDRAIKGIYADVISAVNNWNADVIAVDIPSGIFCDTINSDKIKLKAIHTVSFQLPKLAFYLNENREYLGEIHILDIGLLESGIKKAPTNLHLIAKEDLKYMFPKRLNNSHKGNYGHVCIMAGSTGNMGAAILCAKASLRSGSGLVSLYIPKNGLNITQTAIPEAMCITDLGENYLLEIPNLVDFDAIAIGPGMGQNDESLQCLQDLITNSKSPLVMDADALNLLSKNEHLLKEIPENSILTPHPGEFKRLAGEWENDLEKLNLQREFSKKYKVIIVLKGANTSISDPNGNIYFNSTGNPGMATAGSGDSLTGIILAQMGKSMSALDSAISAVFLHGLAGDLAVKKIHEESLIASDITNHLSEAFKNVQT